MAFDDTLLDDPARLAEADVAGVLHAAAMAGAQVRAQTEAATELRLRDRLDLGRPRALVLLSRPGVSRSVTSVLSALLGPTCPVPVVVSELVPTWINALDVVFVHSTEPVDRQLAESLERASRVGAMVVLSGVTDGPVVAAVAGKGIVFTSRVAVPPDLTFMGGLAAGLLTTNALGLTSADLAFLADHLDAEAERDHLTRDSFANPAKALTLRTAERLPLLWGLDSVAEAVATHAAYAFAAHAATVCDVADYRHAFARPALHRAVVKAASERDLFADEDESVGPQPRVLLLSVHNGRESEMMRYQADEWLPDAEVVTPMEEVESADAVRASVLALRFELAAIYLGLASGSIGELN